MEIYVVQQGDTIDSIAQKFGITNEKLIRDNGIARPFQLVIGQTLVIAKPLQVYTVEPGDTLAGIAETFHVTVLQLLRNNPDLANRQYIYPGETLVIRYNNNSGDLLAVGFTYPFINIETLKMTLPNLTYLTILNYRMTGNGDFIASEEDTDVIQIAKLYDTPATLIVTVYSPTGEVILEDVQKILTDSQIQDLIIDKILIVLKSKGYYGVNLAFQFVNELNQQLYMNFLTKVSSKLKPFGYFIFITINPGLKYDGKEVTFEKINYSDLSALADGLMFLSYDWGSTVRPPIQISIPTTSSFLDYIVAQVPIEKIRIGLPTLGYDWQLPYVPGSTKANALNFDSVLTLASQMNAVINYDENSQSAYFNYTDVFNNQHIVWFKDARSIDSGLKILKSYGIHGIGIWNIMYYFSQMWLVINAQYQIEKL